MVAGQGSAATEPEVVLLDVSDPPGGRYWLPVADALRTLSRLRRDRTGGSVCCVVVGAPPVLLPASQVRSLRAWARRLPEPAATDEPWTGQGLVARLLTVARDAVADLDATAERENGNNTNRVNTNRDTSDCDTTNDDKSYGIEERAASTAVVAAVKALLDAPVVHVEELLGPGGAGPWMRWARRQVAGRLGNGRPVTGAADPATIDVAAREAATTPGPGRWRANVVTARVFDPVASALAAAKVEGEQLAVAAPGRCPVVPVVVPPRPHRITEVVSRQQRVAWDGTVKWGNTWTRELTERLHEYLKLGDDCQVLTTVSGTAALRMAYEAVAPHAAPGDVAVVPSFTFPATGESLRQLGYRLRFVDVDPVTWTMDPVRLRAALADGSPRLVVTVDALGAPAAHEAIAEIAREHGVPVVSDSAPALGSLYRGSPVGTQQLAHAFSLSFAKTVTAGGAGGALVLPSDAIVDGWPNWWRSSSMTEVHAVFAVDQLKRIDELVARRQHVADVYDEVIGALGIRRQQVAPGDRHSWVHYVIQTPSAGARERVERGLAERGVQTKAYYSPVLHDASWQDAFAAADGSAAPENLPTTEVLAVTTLALPMSSELSTGQVEQVAAGLDVVLRREV